MTLRPCTAGGDLQLDERGDIEAVQADFAALGGRPRHMLIHPDNVERLFVFVRKARKQERRAARMARKRRRGWA